MKWYTIVVVSAVFGGFLLASVHWLHRPHRHMVPVAETPPINMLPPDMRVEDMHLLEQAGPTTGWEIVAKKADWYNAEQHAVLHQLHAWLFGRTVDPLHMTAAHGQIARVTGDIAVQGDVRLRYQEGYTIETETLYWCATDRVLYTDVPVKIHSASITIAGTGLHSMVDQHRIALQHSVQASFQLR